MKLMNSATATSRVPRWLAAVGIGLCLAFPLSANAAHQDVDAVEILVGAAVAYALIDVAGGFDDKDRHRHAQRHTQYRNNRWDRYDHRYRDRGRHDYKHHYKYQKRHPVKPVHPWRPKHKPAHRYRTHY